MPTPPVTIPQPTEPWKPTRAQVHAAARAFARVDTVGWHALTQAQRDDLLIDAHAALVEAAKFEPPRVALHAPARQGDAMVCMSKEHADLYAELLIVSESMMAAATTHAFDGNHLRELHAKRSAILARLRSLTSPERTTP